MTTMMRAGLVAAALMAGAALPAQAQRAGVYEVSGSGIDGSAYAGLLLLQQVGLASWEVQWQIGGTRLQGVGMSSGNTMAVAFSVGNAPGMTIYSINPDGSMSGQWTMIGSNGIGTESAIPRR